LYSKIGTEKATLRSDSSAAMQPCTSSHSIWHSTVL